MYNETVKFRFCDNVTTSDRFEHLAGLFNNLDAQSINGEQLVNGNISKYQIKSNGKVSLLSFYPGSTSIIKKFVKFKKKQGIVE